MSFVCFVLNTFITCGRNEAVVQNAAKYPNVVSINTVTCKICVGGVN